MNDAISLSTIFIVPSLGLISQNIETILVTTILLYFLHANAATVVLEHDKVDQTEINNKLDLFGLGVANLVSSFFQSQAVGGAFSRTSLAISAGIKTRIGYVVGSSLVVLAVLFLGKVFSIIPNYAFAAIIIYSISPVGLKKVPMLKRFWRIDKIDFWVMFLSFVAVVVTDVALGLYISIGLSVLSTVLRMKITKVESNISVIRFSERIDVKIMAPLHFLTCENIEKRLTSIDIDRKLLQIDLLTTVIDGTGVKLIEKFIKMQNTDAKIRVLDKNLIKKFIIKNASVELIE